MKVQQLEAELQDLSSQESKDEASLAKVKKQLRDLEAKVKDQEEELDEQAGTIQMLEQVNFNCANSKKKFFLERYHHIMSVSQICLCLFLTSCYIFVPLCRCARTQAKLRLEMEMESRRQTHSKEIESKDEEVDEIRRSCSKKVGAAHIHCYIRAKFFRHGY